MWSVLEQYGFLKTIFSFNTERIREAAFWGIVANSVIMLMGALNYFANDVLGISAAVAIMIFIIVFGDLITGISASYYEEKTKPIADQKPLRHVFSSKKGLKWAFKFCSYTIFIYVLNSLVQEVRTYEFDWLTYPMNVIKLFVIFTICFWELKSIDENFEKMGWSFQIFKLLNPIYAIFKKLVKKNVDVDLDDNGK